MNLEPMLRRLSILDRHKGTVSRFDLNQPQIDFLHSIEDQHWRNNGRVRKIVLKARQMGFSTVTQGINFLTKMSLDNHRGMTIAHKDKATGNLHNMAKTYWRTFPYKSLYATTVESNTRLEWTNGSYVQTETAGAKDAGRSGTTHFVHASEVAFWENASDVMLSLLQSVPTAPNTFVILESTANGVGNYFHKKWQEAIAGESEYEAEFFPWWVYPEYRASAIGIPYHDLGTLDSDEKALKALSLDDDQLAWRRWAIRNLADGDLRKFHQEYPATPEEAFLSTGMNLFELGHLKKHYVKPSRKSGVGMSRGRIIRDKRGIRFLQDEFGPLTIFRLPSPNQDYIIGADATHTTVGDWAVGQVVNRRTHEVVAVWRDKVDPGSFAHAMFDLGLYYNTALLAPEKEGPGQTVIGILRGKNYPMIWQHAKIDKTPGKVVADTWGWSTNRSTKHLAVQYLRHAFIADADPILGRNLIIHDAVTFSELQGFVIKSDGTYGNADDVPHDDTVMALAIAITCNELFEEELPMQEAMPSGLVIADEMDLEELPVPGWMQRNS